MTTASSIDAPTVTAPLPRMTIRAPVPATPPMPRRLPDRGPARVRVKRCAWGKVGTEAMAGARGQSPSRERGQAGATEIARFREHRPVCVDVLMDDYLTSASGGRAPSSTRPRASRRCRSNRAVGRTHDEPLRIRSQACNVVGMHQPRARHGSCRNSNPAGVGGTAWLGASDTGDLPGFEFMNVGYGAPGTVRRIVGGNWRGRYPSSSVMCRTPHEYS